MVTYRDVVVAPVPLAALGTPPVLVPDVVAELHAGGDLLLALGHRAAALAHVVLLLRPLGPEFSTSMSRTVPRSCYASSLMP